MKRLRVFVDLSHGMAEVRLVRRWSPIDRITDYATVARINLAADDADERIAEARMKAKDMARQLNALERP